MKKMLVVYYSWSNGNTKRIAEQLTNGTGADIARIETTEPYSGSHEDVVEQGKREVEAGFMPQINPISVNLSDYDVIAIGTPTWWYTLAPAVLTFLTTNDFTGKTVIPFMTNGGWPGCKVLCWSKLHWIYENTYNDFIVTFSCCIHQTFVSFMKISHRWHETYA